MAVIFKAGSIVAYACDHALPIYFLISAADNCLALLVT